MIRRSSREVNLLAKPETVQSLLRTSGPALLAESHAMSDAPHDAIDPKVQQDRQLLADAHAKGTGATLKAFYHSHPNHDAYFSAEDKAGATPFGEPTYPEAAQIVVSIYDRIVKRVRAYVWNPECQDFVEVPVTTPSL